uniref:COR413-PM2 n=1 Tax=Solanum tuberosum TaxID=4113 RepID=M1CCW4_SOLTU
MGMKKSYLAMKREASVGSDLIDSDLKEIGIAAKKLANHAIMLGGIGFGTSFLKWIASFAAMYVILTL